VNGPALHSAERVRTVDLVYFDAGGGHRAKPGEVPADVLWTFGAYYVPITLGLWMTMLAVMSAYTINRDTHEENLRALAKRASAD